MLSGVKILYKEIKGKKKKFCTHEMKDNQTIFSLPNSYPILL